VRTVYVPLPVGGDQDPAPVPRRTGLRLRPVALPVLLALGPRAMAPRQALALLGRVQRPRHDLAPHALIAGRVIDRNGCAVDLLVAGEDPGGQPFQVASRDVGAG